MRTVSCAPGVFAERSGEQYRIHALGQIVLPNEFTGKLVVGPVAENKLHFVIRIERRQIFGSKGVSRT